MSSSSVRVPTDARPHDRQDALPPLGDRELASRQSLARLGGPMMALVLLEFLLGMGLNLFTILPMGTPAEVLGASPLLIVHLVVGVLVVGISVRATFLASQSRFPRLLAVTAFGLASALGSFLAGLSFAFGGQSAVSSYVMATGAVGVLIVAAVLLWFQGTVSAAARTVPPIRSGG